MKKKQDIKERYIENLDTKEDKKEKDIKELDINEDKKEGVIKDKDIKELDIKDDKKEGDIKDVEKENKKEVEKILIKKDNLNNTNNFKFYKTI